MSQAHEVFPHIPGLGPFLSEPNRDLLFIELGDHRYPIRIGEYDFAGALRDLPAACRQVLVVSNDRVAPLYAEAVMSALRQEVKQVDLLVLQDGETHKDWASLQAILTRLAELGADRQVLLVALGGGVIGDLTGFAAAVYMRGVRFLQIPTTLLAQVDSAVGGKTGINLPQGKNLVGAFHQPVAVWSNLACLSTLPQREFSAGLAEVIKYGPIADAAFFAWLEAHADQLVSREPDALAIAVRRSCEIKAAVVAADEREGGLRAILNFGHTFGHALETGLGYGELLHGEAVGLGMLMAAELSVRHLAAPAELVPRLHALLQRCGLPVQAPFLEPKRFLQLMRGDKKSQSGTVRYVLTPRVGAAALVNAPDALALDCVARHSLPAH